MIGTWNRRDPLGYVDGLNIIDYVRNQPPISKDPYGLKTLVGVLPPTQTDPRKCVIWREDDGKKRCYTECNGGPSKYIQCPNHPIDDPEGPSYQAGINGFMNGQKMLKRVCDDCAADSGCSVAECRREVDDIIFRLIAAWQNNYGNGCHQSVGDPVGGHFCWDWRCSCLG